MATPNLVRARIALWAGILAASPLSGSLAGQTDGPNATPFALRTEYLANMKRVEEKVLALADAFTQAQYGWRPGAGVRSVSETLMHIASEHYFYLPGSIGAKPPADLNMGAGRELLDNLEKITDKAEVIRHLKAAFAYQKSVLEGADAILAPGKVRSDGQEPSVNKLFNAFISDQHEHLGQLIAYARINGVVPPWSKKGG